MSQVYDDGVKVDQMAKAYQAAHGCDYRTAVLAIMKGEQLPELKMHEKEEAPTTVKRYVYELKR